MDVLREKLSDLWRLLDHVKESLLKKIAKIIYFVSFGLCVLYFINASIFFKLDVTKKNEDEGYGVVSGYQYEKADDGWAPLRLQERYTFQLDKVDGSYRELVFYTIHQNAEVYVGNDCVYKMSLGRHCDVGKTPGCLWNRVRFDEKDAGKEITVVIYPVYKSSIGIAPTFYYGNLFNIVKDIFFKGLPVIMLCLIGIAAGIVFIGYTLYNYKNSEFDKGLLMLGFFSLVISLWKLTDAPVTRFIFSGAPIIYMMPFLMLQLMSIPFIMFIKEMFRSRDSKIWYIPVLYSTVVLALTLIMQAAGVRDMRQNLLLIHGGLLLAVAVTIYMVVYEFRTVGWNYKLKNNIFFLALCFLGMGVDMGCYYITRGTKSTPMGMFGMIVYIFTSAAYSLQESRELMKIGVEARNFERKAYHDQLTGLLNRTAYAEYVDGRNFFPDECIVAVFDLNNLKKCNDTLGHEKGDTYIKECASMISKAFGDIGKCYRMGGDEFSVLIEHSTMNVCQQRMNLLQNLVNDRNRHDPEIHMGIAFGFERFDTRIDYDINDTTKRADKKMYAEKIAMKQAEEGRS